MRDQKVESSSVNIDRVIHVILNREPLQDSVYHKMLTVWVVKVAVGFKVVLLQEVHFLGLIYEELWLVLTKSLVL